MLPKESPVIRATALCSLLCLPLLAALPAQAQTLVAIPVAANALVHFDTPGHQTADVTQIQYRRHYHHRRYRRRYHH